jgi:hypothetical protein
MKRSIQLALAAIILLSTLATEEAKAQWWNTGTNATNNQDPKKRRPPIPPLPDNAYKTVNLVTAPNLAYFPQWTGYKPLFLDGHFYPNLPPIEVYTAAWAYKEPAGTVISWYSDALGANGWVINRAISRENMIVARHAKEPIELQFQVSPAAKPGYRCTAEVRWTKNPKVYGPRQPRRS